MDTTKNKQVLNKYYLLGQWERMCSFVRENIIILVLLFLYIFFNGYWESLIGNHLINKFLCHFESNWFIDIIFFIAIALCVTQSIINKGKSIKQSTKLLCVIAILFWIYYRLCSPACGSNDSSFYIQFVSLSQFEAIKYIDIIPFYAICRLVSPLIGKPADIKFIQDYAYRRDDPIKSKEEDKLLRATDAGRIVKKLLETNVADSSFSLGIVAPWGSGKTSYLNLMKARINEHRGENDYSNSIVLNFNPWIYANDKDLVSVFFEELSKCLKRYDLTLAKDIIDYSKMLSSFNTAESKLMASLIDLGKEKSSLPEKKKKISDALKRIKRRIVVFIDDLDRLDADEIMEMLKLIRNMSDFPYMYFVAAYDRSYLESCLEKKMGIKGPVFLEKIFQHEHRLKSCNSDSIRDGFLNNLPFYFDGPEKKKLRELLQGNLFKLDDSIGILSNLRESKRAANGVSDEQRTYGLEIKDSSIKLLLYLFKVIYPIVFENFIEACGPSFVRFLENDHAVLGLTHFEKGKMHNFHLQLKSKHQEWRINDEDEKYIRRIIEIIEDEQRNNIEGEQAEK